LRKNWLPSLVKNLEPLVEMVGMAETRLSREPRRMESSMFVWRPGLRPREIGEGGESVLWSTNGRTAERQY
jgi:hypothetical protein